MLFVRVVIAGRAASRTNPRARAPSGNALPAGQSLQRRLAVSGVHRLSRPRELGEHRRDIVRGVRRTVGDHRIPESSRAGFFFAARPTSRQPAFFHRLKRCDTALRSPHRAS